MDDPGFRVEEVERPDGRSVLRFEGRLRFRTMHHVWSELRETAGRCGQQVEIDLSEVRSLDGGAVALILELRSELAARGAEARIVGAQPRVQGMLDLYGEHPARASLQSPPTKIGILDEIGRETRKLFAEARVLDFVGDTMVAGLQAARRPS